MSLMGLDVGLTGCKAVIFNPEGHLLAQSYREYGLYQPQPGWMELDPGEVWDSVKLVIREAVVAVPQDPVRAFAISTHGESVVPLDQHGNPIGRFISALDTRAMKEAEYWEKRLGRERIFKLTGTPLHPMYSINKLMWLKANEPEIYSKSRHFVCMADFLYSRFGFAPTMDYSLAARTMAFNPQMLKWSDEILDLAGIDKSQLSNPLPGGTVIGEVGSAITAELGLPKGVLAVVGGHDQPSGAIGCGAVSEGVAMDSTGTVECIALSTQHLVLDLNLLASNIPVASHAVPGMYLTFGWATSAGSLLRWFRDNFSAYEQAEAAKTGKDVYDLILEQSTDEISPVLILPHFAGSATPMMDPKSKGAILNLDTSTTRAQIIKGLMESITYEIKFTVDAMVAADMEINEIRAFGGGARSEKWLQVKADILNKPIIAMDVAEVPCLGMAILAGTAIKEFSSIADGVKQMVRSKRTYYPNPTKNQQYSERFALFSQIYPTLKSLNHQM